MRAPPSFYDLKKRDVEQFKRAGRSKPITDVLEK
jgi:hypothetical protein